MSLKGFKTVVFGLLIAAISVLSDQEIQKFVTENFREVGTFIGVTIIILRAITDSPIFKKPTAQTDKAPRNRKGIAAKTLCLILLAGLFIGLVGCGGVDPNATVPLTAQERYVKADGAYKALLETVKEGAERGTIIGEHAKRVKTALTSAKLALDVWALNPENMDAESQAILALRSAREVLRAVTPESSKDPPGLYVGALA